YYNKETGTINSFIINSKNTFTFVDEFTPTKEQIDSISNFKANIFRRNESSGQVFFKILEKLNQPLINILELIYVPIFVQNEFKGFIGVYTLKEKIYSVLDLNTIIEISNVLQIALNQFENQRLIKQKTDEIEFQNKNLALLNEAKNKLINNLTVDDVFADLLDLLFTQLNNIDRASVLKFDFDKKFGVLHYTTKKHNQIRYKDLPFDRLFLLDSFVNEGLYDEFDYDLKPNLNEDERKWYYKGIRSAFAAPIYINKKLYASINLFSNVPGNFVEIKNTITQIISSTQLIIDQLITKGIISEKNKNISDNISYAKRIQDAFLPNEDTLKKVFGSSFALLMQRDALGGDFYWVKEQNNYSLLAVGDCTGHGVSGALLTVLATSYLNTIIDKWQNFKPGIILDLLSSSIYNSLHQKNSDEEINDGLDISFITYNKEDRMVLFSGAMHTLYLNRNGEILEFKGTRKPIGLENKNLVQNYDTQFIQLEKGDIIYLTSDGAIDQFSSLNDKRLGGKRFKEILLSLKEVGPKSRKRRLIAAISEWQANANQTDDICVVSFEVE
ncbi:MAG: serine/threonine-protein phosphatase, partial [Flavobacteriales bacterium]|nr:serine/threonine-protein phosphatase [Flavobacteriales bacterium]